MKDETRALIAAGVKKTYAQAAGRKERDQQAQQADALRRNGMTIKQIAETMKIPQGRASYLCEIIRDELRAQGA